MDWISFLWGVGAFLFVNIVYAILVLPKQLKEIDELVNSVREAESFISNTEEEMKLIKAEHSESMKLWEERAIKLKLELDKLTSSFKLRKSCPSCGCEFPIYIMEEK